MRAFLKLVTRGRAHAIAFTGAIIVLLPPLFFVSGGLIALVTLRYGAGDGGVVLAGSMALAAAATRLLFGSIEPVVGFFLFMGLPVWVLALTLRHSRSQGVMLTCAGLLGALAYLALYLHGDPVAFWRGLLERVTVAQVAGDPRAVHVFSQLLDRLEPALGGLPTGIMMCSVLIVLLGRSWHAALDNPGGFGREFRALRLDRRVAWVAVGISALALLTGRGAEGLGADLMQLAVSLFMLQGIAIAHALVTARQASTGWLAAMYLLLLLVGPLATLLLAVSGLSDTWVDYRRRFGRIS